LCPSPIDRVRALEHCQRFFRGFFQLFSFFSTSYSSTPDLSAVPISPLPTVSVMEEAFEKNLSTPTFSFDVKLAGPCLLFCPDPFLVSPAYLLSLPALNEKFPLAFSSVYHPPTPPCLIMYTCFPLSGYPPVFPACGFSTNVDSVECNNLCRSGADRAMCLKQPFLVYPLLLAPRVRALWSNCAFRWRRNALSTSFFCPPPPLRLSVMPAYTCLPRH